MATCGVRPHASSHRAERPQPSPVDTASQRNLPQLTQARQGEPLVPYKSFPQPAQPAPRGGVAVFATIDLLKAPILPKAVRAALGGDVSEKK